MNERYRDASLPTDRRVDALLESMTPSEKIAQLAGVWVTDLLVDKRFSSEHARTKLEHGIGHLTRVAAATGLRPVESAALANEIQSFLRERTRLGIPAIVHEESCAGYMARDANCFPQAIGQASTWDPALVEGMGRIIRRQMRSVGAHHALAPVLDITRDPRWGRVEETYGEDPYLVTRMGVAYIRGLQGDALEDGVIATAKHFLGYGMSEGGLNWAPARLMPRETLEIFALPFEAAIREADVASVMNAYHEMDGVPCGASRELMVELLRERLGFDGVVVSDYFTVNMLVEYHRTARDKTEAARLALEAGIDVELPAHDCYGDPLRAGLENGTIDMALVDTSVRRLLEQKFRLGLFERPYVATDAVLLPYGTDDARSLSREMARKSMVLLQNDGILPLSREVGSVALLGPGADDIRLLQGDYHYPAHVEVMFESQGNLPAPTPMIASTVGDLNEHYPPMTSLLEGLRAHAGSDVTVRHARGCGIVEPSTAGVAEAVETARRSDVAVVVVGDRSGLTNHATCGEARDRAEITLPGVQEELVDAVIATGVPVVLVILGGRPLALTRFADRVRAILCLWLPGEEGGTAFAEVLFGEREPGGRLPITFPRSSGQIPAYYNHKPSGGRSHWKGDYVDMPVTPLFPFGHGLSYTRFEYEGLEIPDEISAGDDLTVEVTVRNVGGRAGDDVVQLYLRDLVGSVSRPLKELKGFARVTLEPGESKRVRFDVPADALGFYDAGMRFVIEPGTLRVMIGASSQDIRLEGDLEVRGNTVAIERKTYETPTSLS